LGGVIDIVDEQSSQIVVLLLPVWAAEQWQEAPFSVFKYVGVDQGKTNFSPLPSVTI
jgi:hypothetical protein